MKRDISTGERGGHAPVVRWFVLSGSVIPLLLTSGGVAAAQSSTQADLAFDTSAGIHLVRADGTGYRHLVTDSGARRPRWSPSGRVIAYEQTASAIDRPSARNMIRLVNLDGKGKTSLTRGLNPEWSDDGREIIFERFRDPTDKARVPGRPIYAISVRTRKTRQLAPEGTPRRSPDGRFMSPVADIRPGGEPTDVCWEDPRLGTVCGARVNPELIWGLIPADGAPPYNVVVPQRGRPAFRFATGWAPDGSFTYSCGVGICSMHPVTRKFQVRFRSSGRARDYLYQAEWSSDRRLVAVSGPLGLAVRNPQTGKSRYVWRNERGAFADSRTPFSPRWRP